MKSNINCILLIDDNPHDNFFHGREIKKFSSEIEIIIKQSGLEALEYLESMVEKEMPIPNLIFLDINMPGMSGWEFLEEYKRLNIAIHSKVAILMLTTADNPESIQKAKSEGVISDYIIKPLTKELMEEINEKHFKF